MQWLFFAETIPMDIKNKINSCDVNTGECTTDEPVELESIQSLNNGDTKPVLTYYYDALCGWCYGFSPVINRVAEEYNDQLNVKVVSGGLFLGPRAGKVNDVAPHIKAGAYKSVEQRTGVKFGEKFLSDLYNNGEITLDSFPLSVALCIVKEHLPQKALEFASSLLKAVYFDGMNPVNLNEYQPYIEEIGLKKELFLQQMGEDKFREMAIADFKAFQSSQFGGMPSLILEKGDHSIPISSGYMEYDELKYKLEELLKSTFQKK